MKENCFEAEIERLPHACRWGTVMQRKLIGLWLLMFVFLLTACGKYVAEETLPLDMTTRPTAQAGEGADEEELPQVTIPRQTEPVTQPTQPQEVYPSDDETTPSENTEPPQVTNPMAPTDETESPEETEPTESPRQPGLGEDELPLVPVG